MGHSKVATSTTNTVSPNSKVGHDYNKHSFIKLFIYNEIVIYKLVWERRWDNILYTQFPLSLIVVLIICNYARFRIGTTWVFRSAIEVVVWECCTSALNTRWNMKCKLCTYIWLRTYTAHTSVTYYCWQVAIFRPYPILSIYGRVVQNLIIRDYENKCHKHMYIFILFY